MISFALSYTHTLAGQMTRRSSGDCSSAAQVQQKEQQQEELEPVGDLQDLCAFCLYPKHDPVWLLCRHSFCRSCLHLYRQALDWPAKSCPLCRRSLSEPPPPRCHRCCSGKKKQQQLCLKHVSEVSLQFLTPLFTFPSPPQHWRMLLLLLLALLLLSFGPFFLLLIYW